MALSIFYTTISARGRKFNLPVVADQPPLAIGLIMHGFIFRWSKENGLFRVCSMAGILLITIMAYWPTFNNGFTNWDDDNQLTNNPLVRSLVSDNLKKIFTTTVDGLYIPLTILSFAVEYHFFGYNPFVYHFNNLLLHLAVVGLVFVFSRQCRLSFAGSCVALLIFALHPMRVESVAWATERKDVLYAFFYMLSLVVYGRYLETYNRSYYFCSLGTGVLSMLAKPMALSLPLILLLYDWFYGRRLNLKVFLEKIPYFIYIIPITWLTYSHHARIPLQDPWTAVNVWLWTSSFYIKKFFFPVTLSPYYEVPQPLTFINPSYGGSAVVWLVLIALLISFKRQRYFMFAFLFFFLSMFFLFRFDVGSDLGIVADRFVYLPSLGICIWLGYLWENLNHKLASQRRVKIFAQILLGGLILCLAFKTHQQTAYWKDSLTLWNAVIDQGYRSAVVFNNRGEAYNQEKKYDLAMADYNTAIRISPLHASAYNNRADIHIRAGRDDLAIEDYNQSLLIKRTYQTYYNRGNIYVQQGRLDLAMNDYNEAIKIQPSAEAFNNRGLLFMGLKDYKKAIEDFNKAVQMNPRMSESYNNRGYTYRLLQEYPAAIRDCDRAIFLDPDLTTAFFNRSMSLAFNGQYDQAIADLDRVLKDEPQNAYAYFVRSRIYREKRDYQKALVDAFKAEALGAEEAKLQISELQGLIAQLN